MPVNTNDKKALNTASNKNSQVLKKINTADIFSFNLAPENCEIFVDYNNTSIKSDQFDFTCSKKKINIQNGIISIIIIKNKHSINVYLKNPNIDFKDNKSSFQVKMKNDYLIISISTSFKIIVNKYNLLFSSTASEEIIYNENLSDEQKAELSQMKDNKTLVISEEKNKTFLPYTIKELCSKYDSSKYTSITDFINAEYTISNDYFKFPIYSRFKEGYKLVREKEHGSIQKAINLGIELMFNSKLNPSIITACKNLTELNMYLDCLEENELSKFLCFDIKYEMNPAKL